MEHAFVFDNVAVVVGPWHEPMEPPERGARIEVRLLDHEPRRGSPSAAQRVVIDRPLFRADLFDQVDGPPGNLRSAHFHPHFEGVEPCIRTWPEGIADDPLGWLRAELGDLEQLVKRAGVEPGDVPGLDQDAKALFDALPRVVAAVEAAWTEARGA
jgi:hypothetical protein